MKNVENSKNRPFSDFVTCFLLKKEVLKVLDSQKSAADFKAKSAGPDIAAIIKSGKPDDSETDSLKRFFSRLLLNQWRDGKLEVRFEMQWIHYESLKSPYAYQTTLYEILCKTPSDSGRGNSVTKDTNAIIAASLISCFAEKNALKE